MRRRRASRDTLTARGLRADTLAVREREQTLTRFTSEDAYWDFARELVDSGGSAPEGTGFLEAIAKIAADRVVTLDAGTVLWRAQRGYAEPDAERPAPLPHPPERMVPLREGIKPGRANSEGMRFLYLATDKETAMLEMRPRTGDRISVGEFATGRPLRLVNLAQRAGLPRIPPVETPSHLWDGVVWNDVCSEFRRPVSDESAIIEYRPTQLISQSFQSAGYDGVAFASAMGRGGNVALFDVDSASIFRCQVFVVESMSLTSSPFSIPYDLRQARPDVDG